MDTNQHSTHCTQLRISVSNSYQRPILTSSHWQMFKRPVRISRPEVQITQSAHRQEAVNCLGCNVKQAVRVNGGGKSCQELGEMPLHLIAVLSVFIPRILPARKRFVHLKHKSHILLKQTRQVINLPCFGIFHMTCDLQVKTEGSLSR